MAPLSPDWSTIAAERKDVTTAQDPIVNVARHLITTRLTRAQIRKPKEQRVRSAIPIRQHVGSACVITGHGPELPEEWSKVSERGPEESVINGLLCAVEFQYLLRIGEWLKRHTVIEDLVADEIHDRLRWRSERAEILFDCGCDGVITRHGYGQ